MQGHRYGCHRVLDPVGSLPQPAWKLDATPQLYTNELLIDVEVINIDSASFIQLKDEAGNNKERLAERIIALVNERGKLHNPVTGSGGMLIGKIAGVGEAYPKGTATLGSRIATLVSLTLTPLHLDDIYEINMETAQVKVKGQAILFETAPFALLPDDLPEHLALALLDVCGAPAQVNRLVSAGDTVLVVGAGGKSGLLSTYMAKLKAGPTGKVIAMEYGMEAIEALRALELADHVMQADAQDAVEMLKHIEALTERELADVVVNCVNVPHTEMGSILCTKDGGTTYFFSMATSFTAAALGAEGVGKDIKLMIGNGYTAGHAELTLQLIRDADGLREYLLTRYAT